MSDTVDLKNLVSVYGEGLGAPQLMSNDVRLIQIRDGEGELVAMFFRLTDVLWGFSTKGEPDWEDHKKALEIDDSKAAKCK